MLGPRVEQHYGQSLEPVFFITFNFLLCQEVRNFRTYPYLGCFVFTGNDGEAIEAAPRKKDFFLEGQTLLIDESPPPVFNVAVDPSFQLGLEHDEV